MTHWIRGREGRVGWNVHWLGAPLPPGRRGDPLWLAARPWQGVVSASRRLPAFFMPLAGRLMVSTKGRRLIERLGDPHIRWSNVATRVIGRRGLDALTDRMDRRDTDAKFAEWLREVPDQDLCWELDTVRDDVSWERLGLKPPVVQPGDVLVDNKALEGRHVWHTRRYGSDERVVVVTHVVRKMMDRASACFTYHEVVTFGERD